MQLIEKLSWFFFFANSWNSDIIDVDFIDLVYNIVIFSLLLWRLHLKQHIGLW